MTLLEKVFDDASKFFINVVVGNNVRICFQWIVYVSSISELNKIQGNQVDLFSVNLVSFEFG